jgi:hypothetical protein
MRFPYAPSRWPAVAALCVSMLLSACGGGSDSGDPQVRLINATSATSLDVYDGTSELIADTAGISTSAYAGIGAGSYTVNIKAAGGSTTLVSQTRSWANSTPYSLIAYERYGAVLLAQITENQTAPTSGSGSLNVYNLATDAGALDIYVTDTSVSSLAGVSATASNVSASSSSGYIEIGQGSYRIRVTAAGDKSDVRLDIPSVTLADQQIATLTLTGTTGGVLVDGVLSTQSGSAAFYRNGNARVRVVAAMTDSTIVSATANSTALASALPSISVGSYVQVAAGTPTVTVTGGGTTISSATQTLCAGCDYTLLVYGTLSGTPMATLLADDNRISDTNASYAKVRLVHAIVDLQSSPLSLYVNNSAAASSVAYGSASDYSSLASTSTGYLQVLSPSASVYASSSNNVTLVSGATYTMFMLGTSSTTSSLSRLQRDR